VSAGRRAVFLDRDGVILPEIGHRTRADRLELLAGAPDAIQRFNARGLRVVVVTNQSSVARGFQTAGDVEALHESLATLLGRMGARVDAWFYCPHRPEPVGLVQGTACHCRKPASGMLERARRELGLDLASSFLIGDKRSDVAAARRVGARALLVLTGHGQREADRPARSWLEVPDGVVETVSHAAEWILERHE
jgi:D-glycero-D-manno-heptose 1,7-bisphosphate phosphatase